MSLFMDCRRLACRLSTDSIKFDTRSQSILDEDAMVEVECQVRFVVCDGISSIAPLDCHHCIGD